MREPYNESESERSPSDAGAVREVRRYPNRRLYDSRSRGYVTTADIRGWIEAGERVRVVDAATREDVTVSALSALLLELIERELDGPSGIARLHEAIRTKALPAPSATDASSPPPAIPNVSDDQSLRERVEALERRVAQLERR